MEDIDYEGAHLKRERIIQNVETKRYKDEISFVDVFGNPDSVQIDRKVLANLRRLHEELVGAGARIPTEFDRARTELKELVNQPCEARARVVNRCGWHGDTYVAGHKAYGRDPNIILDGADDTLTLGMRRGSLEGFVSGIEPLLKRSRLARFAMAAQCGSILSGRVGVQEFALYHIYGQSGLYKTLAVSLAAAMVGRAQKPDLQSHDHSGAGFERMMAFRRHSLCILDEIGTSNLSDYDMFHNLERKAYGVGSGGGGTKAKQGSDTQTVTHKWSQFVVSTGEKSTRQLAGERKQLQKGAQRRLLEFEMKEEGGGICDIRRDGELLTQKEQFEAKNMAKKAITENYGVALPTFIDWILRQTDLKEQYDRVFQSFIDKFQPDSGWMEEVVKKLAHKAAAGVMGVRAGVIPVTEKGMVSSMRHLCKEALRNAGVEVLNGEVLAKQLAEGAQDRSRCPFVPRGGDADGFDPSKNFGFKRKIDGKVILFIPCTTLKGFLGSKAAVDEATQFCKSHDLLLLTEEGDIQESVKLPGGKTKRCYRFKWSPMKQYFVLQ